MVDVGGTPMTCKLFCGRYAGILKRYDETPDAMRYIYDQCMQRCAAGDGDFIGCAVRSRTKEDVVGCSLL